MIDLTKNQVVDPPVKCWIDGEEDRLIAIARGLTSNPFIGQFKDGKTCSLTDPTIPVKKIKKWETIEDVPPELWGKVMVKHKKERPCLAVLMSPCEIVDCEGLLLNELHYLPLGQPLTGEWLPFESEVVE